MRYFILLFLVVLSCLQFFVLVLAIYNVYTPKSEPKVTITCRAEAEIENTTLTEHDKLMAALADLQTKFNTMLGLEK